MVYLILSILMSTSLVVIFKLFERNRIKSFPAIAINYLSALLLGVLFSGNIFFKEILDKPWFWWAVLMGVMFISIFNIISMTVRNAGLSVAAVANKMSVVIPITWAFLYLSESASIIKILGIIGALLSVYLVSARKGAGKTIGFFGYILIAILFVGSGILDTLFKHAQSLMEADEDLFMFISVIFFTAALLGSITLLTMVLAKRVKVTSRELIGGFVLGIPNWASVYFLIQTLAVEGLQSSVVFPVNNVGVVACSTLCGVVLFKEVLSLKNWAGVLLSALSIILISIADKL